MRDFTPPFPTHTQLRLITRNISDLVARTISFHLIVVARLLPKLDDSVVSTSNQRQNYPTKVERSDCYVEKKDRAKDGEDLLHIRYRIQLGRTK